jgi:hypothetical protein
MSRRSLINLIVLAALLLVGAYLGLRSTSAPGDTEFGSGKLAIETASGRHVFTVEIADTPAARAQGLMYRTSMAADAGMLFDFQSEQPVSMWMKNTYIPLDMLFIDAAGRVRNIAQRTVPESLKPIASDGRVLAVLELNSGAAARLGIAPGDQVFHALFGNAD